MGQAQTVPSIVKSGPRDVEFEQNSESGVRITGSLAHDIEAKIKRAYDLGREEGTSEFKNTFGHIAAQAQENLRAQLLNMQDDSINQSEKLVC